MTQQQLDIKVLNAVVNQDTARRMVKRARYRRVNARRGELIRLDSLQEASPVELAELSDLQSVVFRIVDLAYPRPDPPFLDALNKLEQRLAEENHTPKE